MGLYSPYMDIVVPNISRTIYSLRRKDVSLCLSDLKGVNVMTYSFKK
jgi:hypothetical protein